MDEKDKIIAFQLRIPESLNDEIIQIAESEKRTKNQQIEWMLEKQVKADKGITSAQIAQV